MLHLITTIDVSATLVNRCCYCPYHRDVSESEQIKCGLTNEVICWDDRGMYTEIPDSCPFGCVF